jgi:hypothetical protein
VALKAYKFLSCIYQTALSYVGTQISWKILKGILIYEVAPVASLLNLGFKAQPTSHI